ncbi:protein phosphatase 1H [Uranotaenia lowii]|uniref:protein phosphatase 1H n=1 Tax=Uranotaenia lowii TaxID=190385 RepID=UPI0024786306|nr:protein phosphatase 1H [Uranotaenia lowii]XP_055590884.1 protein phosphatase 1H [Uranotaenia lowii]
MFNRLKNRVLTVVGPDIPALPSTGSGHGSSGGYSHRHHHDDHGGKGNLPEKFRYARPQFLQLLTYDELKASADHNVRPIIVPRDLSLLPWNTGYAECVNSGKSEWNEDQAAFHRQVLSHPSRQYHDLPYTYYGIYDGHAGYGAALAASNQFHHILHEKLVDIIDLLMPRVEGEEPSRGGVGLNAILPHPILFHKQVSKDELIVGALEAAFADMDALLAEDRDKYRNAGGCTALVALFILGKLFVANAGDSRGILCKRVHKKKLPHGTCSRPPSFHEEGINGDAAPVGIQEEEEDEYMVYAEPCSFDHTPETERPRLLSVGKLNPNLMGGEYVAMEYAKKPMTKDLGTRILYRQGTMKGWTYKTLTRDDLKMPLVTGEGKRSRLLGTIGVTRGFGDHDLKALGSGLPIKPFLSCHPDVVCIDLSTIESDPDADNCDGDYGVLVMATDGLWDVTYSQKVANTVFTTLKKFPTERHRYTMAAQELVAKSRGRANVNGHWRLADSRAAATVDDISVIVVPVYQYYLEYLEWKRSIQKPPPKPMVSITPGAGIGKAPSIDQSETIEEAIAASELIVSSESESKLLAETNSSKEASSVDESSSAVENQPVDATKPDTPKELPSLP